MVRRKMTWLEKKDDEVDDLYLWKNLGKPDYYGMKKAIHHRMEKRRVLVVRENKMDNIPIPRNSD